jgi:hypothetical protein
MSYRSLVCFSKRANRKVVGVLFALSLTCALASAASGEPNKPDALRAQGGVTSVTLMPSALRSLGLSEIAPSAASADQLRAAAPEALVRLSSPHGVLDSLTQADLPAFQLRLRAGAQTLAPILHGRLWFDGALVKTEWRDAQQRVWLRGNYAHPDVIGVASGRAHSGAPRFEVRYIDLRLGPAFVAAIAQPKRLDQLLGVGNVVMPLRIITEAKDATPLGCDLTNFTSPSNLADVELIGLENFEQLRCSDCDGPSAQSNGQIVVAPSAILRNSGTTVVPWYEKFTPDSPPYNNDQHPFLVWNLYRQDLDGVLRQIGQSGVKHAFFSFNLSCGCPAGLLLGVGCFDNYASLTNDTPGDSACTSSFCHQGPRRELIPSKGLFGRCGSVFDPNCDGDQSDITPYGPYDFRLVLDENEISDAPTSGVRWFGDAYYIVRDEGNWINNIGSRELFPSWDASATGKWRFLQTAPNAIEQNFEQGSILHRWTALAPAGARSRLSTLETPNGRIVVDVRARQLTPGQWRYQNTVFNHDFAVGVVIGNGANIAVTDNRGLSALTFQAAPPVAVSPVRMVDADLVPANNWPGSSVPAGVAFQAPGANTQNWGTLYSYIYDSPQPPGEIELVFNGSNNVQFRAAIMGPSLERLFSDGFN